MRIRVVDVLELLAAGMTAEAIIKQLPDLDADDVGACLDFAVVQAGRVKAGVE